MRERLAILIFALGLGACGHRPPHIDEQLWVYASRFEQDLGIPVNVGMSFVPQAPMILGTCWMYPGDPMANYIEIDPAWWDVISESEREELVFHELGHCVLLQEHLTGTIMDRDGRWIPLSIMHMFGFGDPAYTKHRAKYHRGLKANRSIAGEL